MRAWVVYESMFGNTEAVARAIASGLAGSMDVETFEVGSAPAAVADGVDLLVVGAPTHRFGLSRRDSRKAAEGESTAPLVSTGIGLREWLGDLRLPPVAPAAVAFDTGMDAPRWLRLVGSASRVATLRLRRRGLAVVARPETFLVSGMTGPLCPGERERATRWAAGLASGFAAGRLRTA